MNAMWLANNLAVAPVLRQHTHISNWNVRSRKLPTTALANEMENKKYFVFMYLWVVTAAMESSKPCVIQ